MKSTKVRSMIEEARIYSQLSLFLSLLAADTLYPTHKYTPTHPPIHTSPSWLPMQPFHIPTISAVPGIKRCERRAYLGAYNSIWS